MWYASAISARLPTTYPAKGAISVIRDVRTYLLDMEKQYNHLLEQPPAREIEIMLTDGEFYHEQTAAHSQEHRNFGRS
jgi:hypothetical protein